MPEIILPSTMVGLLVAFEPCFTAPSHRTFSLLVAGWIHCLGRRTITGVAVASGGVEQRHISVFHRFFTRARWSLDALGQVVFRLALRWIPADQPLIILVDDTLARKTGKGISLATMHHDPLLSIGPQAVLQLRTRLGGASPLGAAADGREPGIRVAAAVPPVRRGQARGDQGRPGRPRRGTRQQAAERAHAAHPRPTKLALARELLALVAGWADGRTIYAVVDSAYAARPLLDDRPANVEILSRLRPDAALWARPGRRRPGQRGRPRKRGHRLPTPKAMAAVRRRWDPPAAHAVRSLGHPAGLRLHRPLVRRAPRPAGPHRHRARSQWPPSR